MVKLIKADGMNIVFKSIFNFKVSVQLNYFVALIIASNAAICALKALSPAFVIV